MPIIRRHGIIHDKHSSVESVKKFRRSAASAKKNSSTSSDFTDPAYSNNTDLVDWFGFSTVEEIHQVMNDGYPDGVKLVNRLAKKIKMPTLKSARRRKVRRDQGDFLDIHAVYNGNLGGAWEKTERASKNAPRQVSLLVNLTASVIIPSSEYKWRGVAALALASRLEEAGHSVEITGFTHSAKVFNRKKDRHVLSFPVKSFGTPVNLNSLAITLVQPAFFRTFIFEAKFLEAWKVNDGLGTPLSITPSVIQASSSTVLDGFESITSESEAMDYITNAIKQFD
jgi:hypothetical protein